MDHKYRFSFVATGNSNHNTKAKILTSMNYVAKNYTPVLLNPVCSYLQNASARIRPVVGNHKPLMLHEN